MKITVELPDNILDMEELGVFDFLNTTLRRSVTEAVKTELTKMYAQRLRIEDLKITQKELRDAVIEKMAESAIEKLEDSK